MALKKKQSPPTRGLVGRVVAFIQANDRVFQLLAIAIPGLYFTYSYNEWQQYSKQIELSNMLVSSLTSSHDNIQRGAAFSLMAALPNKRVVRQALTGLPLASKIEITKPLVVDAIRTGDAETIDNLSDFLCELVPDLDRSDPKYVENGVHKEGYLTQLLMFDKEKPDQKRDQKLKIASWLMKCRAVLFPEDEFPRPPRLDQKENYQTLQGDLFKEALFSNDGRDVERMIDQYVLAQRKSISDLSSALTREAYGLQLARAGQPKSLLVYIRLLERQKPPTCGVVKHLAESDEVVFRPSNQSRTDPKDWKAVYLQIRNGPLADCEKNLDPADATIFSERFRKLAGS